MTLEVSVISGVAKRIFVSDTDTAISASSSSRSLRNSPTVLRGTITPGMSAAPVGHGRVDPRQPVAVGRHGPERGAVFALGDMEVDAVEVVPRLLGRDGEFGLVEEPRSIGAGAAKFAA
jgi:hypothetical protein